MRIIALCTSLFVFFNVTCISFAGLDFETLKMETKTSAGNKSLTFSFPFKVTKQAITIHNIKTSCGCTTTRLSKTTYQPGEAGMIETFFNISGRKGKQRKIITIYSDDPETPMIHLELHVLISKPLSLSRRFVYWLKSETSPQPKSVEIELESERPVHIQTCVSNNDVFQASLQKKDDLHYSLEVEAIFDQTPMRYQKGQVEITYQVEGDPSIQREKLLCYVK